ncbi:MAG: TraR/DksA family transcriptional regulator [Pseudomonadales bacterium]|nr:TraR/DksA family transcriptional regulator [Pseudomonadales bacterium]
MAEPLTDKQLKVLSNKLDEMEAQLRAALDNNENSSNPVKLDQQLMGRVSRIDAIQQQEMASANRANQTLLLRKVLIAKKLIADGDYGYCRQCDELIGYQRLAIKPEATLCIKCQSAAEQS